MNTATRHTLRSLALAACILAPPAIAAAQDDAPNPAARETETDTDAERDMLRERITRQLDMVRQRQASLESALDMLDRGEPLDAVRDIAMNDMRDRFRERRNDGFDGRNRASRDDARPPHPDDIPRIMEFIQSHNPDLAADLRTLSEQDPEAFHDKLAEIGPRVEFAMRKAEERPERFRAMMQFRRIERESHRLARQIVEEEGDAPDLTLQLRQAVAEGFDLRVRLNQLEIDDTREKLGGMENRADEWDENRDQMIDRHVAELIERAASGEPMRSRRDRWRDRPGDSDRRERGPRGPRPDAP